MNALTTKFLEAMPPTGRILDVGAGKNQLSTFFAEQGYQVTAIDRIDRPEHLPKSVVWIQQDVMNALPEFPAGSFDGVHIRNIIQFLPREEFTERLLPWALKLLRQGGILAIGTFFDRIQYVGQQDGPTREPHPAYYTVEQLKDLLPDTDVLFTDQFRKDAKDMNDEMRNFAITEVVVKKR